MNLVFLTKIATNFPVAWWLVHFITFIFYPSDPCEKVIGLTPTWASVFVLVSCLRHAYKERGVTSYHPFHLQGYLPVLSDIL